MTKKKFDREINNSGLYTGILKEKQFQVFGDFSRQFKICHRTLDGLGFNYSKEKVTSLKGYIKILDSYPSFSDDFLDWLGPGAAILLNLCASASNTLTCRQDGLSGINLSLKYDPISGSYTKSFYVKTHPNLVQVCNIKSDGSYANYQYKYISNKIFIFLIKNFFFLKLPSYYECIEFSLRKNGANATIYPQFKDPKLRDHIGCKKHFSKLKNLDEWNLEYDIFDSVEALNRDLTPITRGYTSFDLTRKLYFGLFSKKLSCFDV